MKKSFFVLAFALFFGGAIIGNSYAALNNHSANTSSSDVYQDDRKHDFKAIELDELPQAVKDAAKKEGARVTLESAERKTLANGEFVYRVTMDVDEKGQVTKNYNASGKRHDH